MERAKAKPPSQPPCTPTPTHRPAMFPAPCPGAWGRSAGSGRPCSGYSPAGRLRAAAMALRPAQSPGPLGGPPGGREEAGRRPTDVARETQASIRAGSSCRRALRGLGDQAGPRPGGGTHLGHAPGAFPPLGARAVGVWAGECLRVLPRTPPHLPHLGWEEGQWRARGGTPEWPRASISPVSLLGPRPPSAPCPCLSLLPREPQQPPRSLGSRAGPGGRRVQSSPPETRVGGQYLGQFTLPPSGHVDAPGGRRPRGEGGRAPSPSRSSFTRLKAGEARRVLGVARPRRVRGRPAALGSGLCAPSRRCPAARRGGRCPGGRGGEGARVRAA